MYHAARRFVELLPVCQLLEGAGVLLLAVAFLANMPLAVAPGMGINAYFT